MCHDYLECLIGELDNLKASIEQNDFEQIHQISHKAKGTAGTYKLNEISQAAERLQELADLKNSAELQEAFDELYSHVVDNLQSL